MFKTLIAFFRICGYLIYRRPQLKIAKRLDREGKIQERDEKVREGVAE